MRGSMALAGPMTLLRASAVIERRATSRDTLLLNQCRAPSARSERCTVRDTIEPERNAFEADEVMFVCR